MQFDCVGRMVRRKEMHQWVIRCQWCHKQTAVDPGKGVTPRLYADNLNCTSCDADDPPEAARYTINSVQPAGEEASPGKWVHLGTSEKDS